MAASGRYRVVLHVAGIAMPLDSGELVAGFYANVVVYAVNETAAVARAIETLRASRKYQAAVGVADPTITLDLAAPLAPRDATPEGIAGGFVYYPADASTGLA